MSLLRTVGLKKTYHGKYVVNGVSLEVKSGEIVGLLGPNGAGKTTTFYMIVGIIKPDDGSVFIDEQDISQLPIHRRARLGIQYLPQEPSVFRKLTVAENILAILQTLDLNKAARNARLEGLLKEPTIKHIPCRGVNGDGLKLPGPWSPRPNSFCWTNPLPA
jgi:lipopolysaccharide export system ATP-binding protein